MEIHDPQTTIDKLQSLCNWYTQDILKNYNTQANKYELAFLYSYNAQCNCHNVFSCARTCIRYKYTPCQ